MSNRQILRITPNDIATHSSVISGVPVTALTHAYALELPVYTKIVNTRISELYQWQGTAKQLVDKTHQAHHVELMIYVASIQPNKRFKVYYDWGDRNDANRILDQGRKLREEAMARDLFPMLHEYGFMV